MNTVIRRFLQTIVAILVVSLAIYVADVSGLLTWLDAKWHKATVERHLWLGASFGDLETYKALWSSEAEELDEQESALVILLVPAGSRAAQLGLIKGDRVLSVNGETISSPHQFKKVIRRLDRHAS